MKRLVIMLLVFSLLLVTGGSTWAVVSLPTANISGNAQTTAGNDTGSFVLVYAFISKVNYLDGTSTSTNGPDESIIGTTVTISGATRTGNYTFTDSVISISDGSFNYLTATLSDIVFLTDEIKWYLNPGLDICDQTTHNLSDIVLNTDVDYPSRYIDEFQSGLDINNISGMKMILDVIPDGGSITGESSLSIFVGLIMGPPPIIDNLPKSLGYWKNHSEERRCFIKNAVSDDIDVLDIFSGNDPEGALRYYLNKTGKKTKEEKVKQHLAALLLNIAAGLDPSEFLTSGQLAILQKIDTSYVVDATIGDAVFEIENAIDTGYDLQRAQDLAEAINTQ